MKNRMKELRARHDLTQEDLAKLVRVTRQTINAIEKNKISPNLSLAFRISKILGEKVDAIFSYERTSQLK